MVGHSKWSKVKHIKGLLVVKRHAAFSKPVKEITVSARLGGGDYVSGNPRLRLLVETVRAANTSEANAVRTLKEGTDEPEGDHYEQILYGGHSPGGVALVIEAATNNKNRTVADLRFSFSKTDGGLAASDSVLYRSHEQGPFRDAPPVDGRGLHFRTGARSRGSAPRRINFTPRPTP